MNARSRRLAPMHLRATSWDGVRNVLPFSQGLIDDAVTLEAHHEGDAGLLGDVNPARHVKPFDR